MRRGAWAMSGLLSLSMAFYVGIDHFCDHVLKRYGGLPFQLLPRLAGISKQHIDLCRAHQFAPFDDMVLIVQTNIAERDTAEVAYRGVAPRRNNVVVGLVLLQHEP